MHVLGRKRLCENPVVFLVKAAVQQVPAKHRLLKAQRFATIRQFLNIFRFQPFQRAARHVDHAGLRDMPEHPLHSLLCLAAHAVFRGGFHDDLLPRWAEQGSVMVDTHRVVEGKEMRFLRRVHVDIGVFFKIAASARGARFRGPDQDRIGQC